MTPEQIKLVQDSFSQVAPIAEQAAAIFYEKLFELDPNLKELFSSADMKVQGNKLMSMIGTAVNGLNNLDALVPAVEDLGRRHVGYGVMEEDYATVGTALIQTLEAGLGDSFTEETMQAWTTVYGVLSSTMMEASNAAVSA